MTGLNLEEQHLVLVGGLHEALERGAVYNGNHSPGARPRSIGAGRVMMASVRLHLS